MHILIAPNAFKNSATATQAANAIAKGLEKSKLACTCECFPIGDGGDGTGKLLIEKFNGKWITAEVHDPLGRKIQASYGLIDNGKTAVIEMAEASGIRLLQTSELNPLFASSYGTGEMIKHALDQNITKMIIGMGGSATVDGGTGILAALGVIFLDQENRELQNLPGSLTCLSSIDSSSLDKRLHNLEIIVLCDVNNQLTGAQGAAAVFGPQKGADEKGVQTLEAALTVLSSVILKETGKDLSTVTHGGTAGGAAAALYALANAKLVNGADTFLELTAFEKSLAISDLVITGEGSIDAQTLQGKGPFSVAVMAKKRKIPVIGLAGKIPVEMNDALREYFDTLIMIGREDVDLATALKEGEMNLERVAQEIGDFLHAEPPGRKERRS